MCLAIPGEIVSVDENESFLRQGQVSFGGILKTVSLALVPEARVGQYVLIHAGVAIHIVDEVEAQKVFECLRELGELEASERRSP
ncbi:MAG: HypC/HybG/HupF family hydrogenase formation chaperone [Candidatus Hydrogenedentes bacterium]|nr:HypC/HybG/HupF family hydrogenase formation chaperone [Candidatus Hydrogenedentota bacterium]